MLAYCERRLVSVYRNTLSNTFRTSLFRDSYFIRIVYLWNDLPLSIRQTPSIKLFKTRLYEHYFKKLDCDFETDRIRTWKTICPNCRSIGRLNCC